MDEKEIKKDMATTSKGIMQNNDSKYVRLFYMRFPKIQTASGQLNLNLNYFKNEICQPDDNPPVGIVLGARKETINSLPLATSFICPIEKSCNPNWTIF